MDRSYASGAAGSAPAAPASPSIGYPTAGNPGTGTPATKPGPYWYHQITEELLAIITAAGITPAQGTLTQLKQALDALYTGSGKAVGIGYMMVRDEKASGNHAGASVIGIQTRVLNTVSANTISGASLSSNQITLPAGTYRVHAQAPAFVNLTKGFLYNVTDAANQLIGVNYNGISGTASDHSQSTALVEGRFTIASAKVFELRQYCSEATAEDGLGASCSQGTEVYSTVEIIKES